MHRTELSSPLAQHPNIYDLQIVRYNYLSVRSTKTTLRGRPNLQLVGYSTSRLTD